MSGPPDTYFGDRHQDKGSVSEFTKPLFVVADRGLRIKLIDADRSADLRKELSRHLEYRDPAASDPKTRARIGPVNLGANASGYCRKRADLLLKKLLLSH